MNNVFASLVELLIKNNSTICSIESFTGGLFSKCLTDIKGSSKVFYGSLVTYKTSIKEDILKVNKEVIEKYGVVSKEVSIEMAKKGKEMFDTDIVISFTGNAGPSVCEDNKQVGECYSSIFFKDKAYSYSFLFENKTREEIRNLAVESMAEKIIELVKDSGLKN